MKKTTLLVLPALLIALGAFGAEDPLQTGDRIPAVILHTAEGTPFNLKAAVAEKPAVLVFYRGGWCPYCTVHLSQLQKIESQLVNAGWQILAISPDRPEKLAEADAKQNYSYTLLSDSKMDASKAFGLAFEVDAATREKYKGFGIDLEAASGETHHLLPVPAVYLAGTDGIIRFAHSNPDYKERLSNEAILEAARNVAPAALNLFDPLFRQYVENGRVDYRALQANRLPLTRALAATAAVTESQFNTWDKNRQLAFLINLYNAATLELIVDHYPVKSIKDIGNWLKGPWDKPVVPMFGPEPSERGPANAGQRPKGVAKKITLNELEHEIIRKQYPDPRIHMALVCAAKGCPPLRNEAYTAEKLDEQLDDQSRIYLASPAGLAIDRPKGEARISSIFKWYGGDFPSVPEFIEQHSGQSLNGLKIKYIDYDWSLNE